MNTVKIGKDVFEVSDLVEAVDAWFAALINYQWPSSKAPACKAVIDGQRYKISYNGRVWDSEGREVHVTRLLS